VYAGYGFFFVSLQTHHITDTDMELIKDKKFGGERPLFAQHDLRIENITIEDGESGI
jgi:hypothetical protein